MDRRGGLNICVFLYHAIQIFTVSLYSKMYKILKNESIHIDRVHPYSATIIRRVGNRSLISSNVSSTKLLSVDPHTGGFHSCHQVLEAKLVYSGLFSAIVRQLLRTSALVKNTRRARVYDTSITWWKIDVISGSRNKCYQPSDTGTANASLNCLSGVSHGTKLQTKRHT